MRGQFDAAGWSLRDQNFAIARARRTARLGDGATIVAKGQKRGQSVPGARARPSQRSQHSTPLVSACTCGGAFRLLTHLEPRAPAKPPAKLMAKGLGVALAGRQSGDGHSPCAFGPPEKKCTMPLIDGMTATSKAKAFVLGSLFASLVATSAVQTRHVLEVNAQAQRWPESAKALATLAGSFVLSLLAYFLLWVLFGYGGGMEISESP